MSKKADIVTILCYGEEEKLPRQKAIAKYMEGVRECEGAERDRYMNILIGLFDGQTYCTDQDY
ncbi:MAG: hypothetical protein IJS19_00335 [Muribaculaceae bacterium]|nr:hypothetical protein [Muribaculaceae bacterium]